MTDKRIAIIARLISVAFHMGFVTVLSLIAQIGWFEAAALWAVYSISVGDAVDVLRRAGVEDNLKKAKLWKVQP